jgi:hypothetical protein
MRVFFHRAALRIAQTRAHRGANALTNKTSRHRVNAHRAASWRAFLALSRSRAT